MSRSASSLALCVSPLALALAAAAQSQGPINLHFDLHVDPLPQVPLPQKRAVYELRTDNIEWVLDQTEPLGVAIAFLSVGEYGELVIDEGPGGDGSLALQRLYATGGQIGSHSHREWRVAPFSWPDVPPDPTLDQCRQSWQDNVDWVNAAVTFAFGGSPPDDLAAINAVKGAHLPPTEPGYHALMAEFGLEVREPGPEEDYYGWYDHHIWHPFRPSETNYMGEDLSAPFVQVTQGSVIGLAQVHHGVFQDMTAANVKRQLLQLYVNWRWRDRTGQPEKVWCWGWGSHAKDFDPGSASRDALLEVLPWLESRFAHRVEPTGSRAMHWSTHQQTRDDYLAWEAAHQCR